MKELEAFKNFLKEESTQVSEADGKGLITFDQLKQAVIDEYFMYYDGDEAIDMDPQEIEGVKEEFNTANNIEELINILDGLGFGGEEEDFIFKAILK